MPFSGSRNQALHKEPKLVGVLLGRPKQEGGLGIRSISDWNEAAILRNIFFIVFSLKAGYWGMKDYKGN